MRSHRYWCWRGWIGGRCWGRYGRKETKIHPLSTYTKGQRASLHIDFRPSCSKKWSPQNDRHMGPLIHIHNKEVAWDDKHTHPNWNVFQDAYKLPNGAIC